MMRGFRVINDGSLGGCGREGGNDLLRGGEGEIFVVAQGEFAAPRVEELDGGGSGGDLRFQDRGSSLARCVGGGRGKWGFAEQEAFTVAKPSLVRPSTM